MQRCNLSYIAHFVGVWQGLKCFSGISDVVLELQGGHIMSCTACEDGQSIASGSSNGSIHVWRVETAGRSNNAPERYIGFTGALQKNLATHDCRSMPHAHTDAHKMKTGCLMPAHGTSCKPQG